MAESQDFNDPEADFETLNPLREDAVRYHGQTRTGKPCVLIDNTGLKLPVSELQTLLEALIANDVFGFRSLSSAGGSTIDLARRETAHVQIGESLYRLIVYRYQARIERF